VKNDSKETIAERVKKGIEAYKIFTQDLFVKYDVYISDDYTLDELKEDVTNHFSSFFLHHAQRCRQRK